MNKDSGMVKINLARRQPKIAPGPDVHIIRYEANMWEWTQNLIGHKKAGSKFLRYGKIFRTDACADSQEHVKQHFSEEVRGGRLVRE